MVLNNPYKPGAGHVPSYLAGRNQEIEEFMKLIQQPSPILKNIIVTGLRGVGKTVFLEEMKGRILQQTKWRWAQNDMSETASISEENLAIRMITDLSVIVSDLIIPQEEARKIGFYLEPENSVEARLSYQILIRIYKTAPGLVSDKLKFLLEYVWNAMKDNDKNTGIVFAYDEAQNLEDHSEDRQYPLSVLLEVFQSLQRKGIPYLLVLTGLPTLFPKLIDSRTYSERMFHVIILDHLNLEDSKEAIIRPLVNIGSDYLFSESIQSEIVRMSGGYPYFLQFISKEAFDFYLSIGEEIGITSLNQILHKLDEDFFMGRWCNTTDREKELLALIANLPQEGSATEFSIRDVTSSGKIKMSSSHVNQSLARLIKKGFVYKDKKHGKYNFAVPLLSAFIKRAFVQEE